MIKQQLQDLFVPFFFRRAKLHQGFFDKVYCNSKKTEETILQWIYQLYKSKKISIEKFSNLFSKYRAISFPIRVIPKSDVSLYLKIIDAKNEVFYFCRTSYDEIEYFSIGKRKYPYDKQVYFKVVPKNRIIVDGIGSLLLNSDGTNKKDFTFSIAFDYDKNIATALLEHGHFTIQIKYTFQDKDFNDAILNYLFELSNSKIPFDNVLPIFIAIQNIRRLAFLMVISKSYSNVLSEIACTNCIVIKYAFIEKIDETHQFTKNYISQRVEDFIMKYSN